MARRREDCVRIRPAGRRPDSDVVEARRDMLDAKRAQPIDQRFSFVESTLAGVSAPGYRCAQAVATISGSARSAFPIPYFLSLCRLAG